MSDLPDAFLVHEGVIYTPVPSSISASAIRPPTETGVTRLIEGVCAKLPEQSRAILRERIYSRLPLTPVCEGMIKVVAKRATVLRDEAFENAFRFACQKALPAYAKPVSDESSIAHLTEWSATLLAPSPTPIFARENAPASFLDISSAAEFALTLKPVVAEMSGIQSTAYFPKSVAAILLNKELAVLAYAWNTNHENRTQHAELNLVRSFLKTNSGNIPADATLIVTLKPCAMCAAQIFAAAENISKLSIFYLEDDPGPKAQNTALMRGSDLWTKAGEPDVQLAGLNLVR